MRKKLGRLWSRVSRRATSRWPRMEQGKYRNYLAVHPFDERFGVETSGLIYDLATGNVNDAYNNGYFAVAPSVFHAAMAVLQQQLHLECGRFTFVDVGSGKGRALLLASDYAFREVIGVELSPSLHRIAQSNIARYAASNVSERPQTRSVLQDATAFQWPLSPLVVYMWNAFEAPVMEQVFNNLKASLAEAPRELYLVYMHPELEGVLAGLPWLTPIWREEIAMSAEDNAAWAFPSHAEVCAMYRVVPSGLLQTKV